MIMMIDDFAQYDHYRHRDSRRRTTSYRYRSDPDARVAPQNKSESSHRLRSFGLIATDTDASLNASFAAIPAMAGNRDDLTPKN